MGLTATIKTATQKTTTTTKQATARQRVAFSLVLCDIFASMASVVDAMAGVDHARKPQGGEESDPSVHTCGIHG